jgi:hypothetical protein
MTQPSQPTDSDLACWMRDTFKQTVEDAEHDPDVGEDTYIGTIVLAVEPTHVGDAGADGFTFRQNGVEYTVRITARRLAN